MTSDIGYGGFLTPAAAMDLAVELAGRGPAVDPNPRVGAVLLSPAGALIGAGYHRGAGTPHAEIAALNDASRRADPRGATVYVTLEPCAHTGRTGPCADALERAGVAAVVYAESDPGAESGGGAALLRSAGIPAEHAPHVGAVGLNPYWRHALRTGRPWVTWKFASTLDGRVAAADGTSQWITSADARADVHVLRAACGAVLIGTGTAWADDPQLTVRDGGARDGAAARVQPLRVVLGRRDLPRGARLRDAAAHTLQVRSRNPFEALEALQARGIRRVLLETGPTVAAAFLRAGLVDEIVAYLAPALLGAGPHAVASFGVETIGDIARFDIHDLTRVGPDVRLGLRRPAAPCEPDAHAPDTHLAGGPGHDARGPQAPDHHPRSAASKEH